MPAGRRLGAQNSCIRCLGTLDYEAALAVFKLLIGRITYLKPEMVFKQKYQKYVFNKSGGVLLYYNISRLQDRFDLTSYFSNSIPFFHTYSPFSILILLKFPTSLK